jgi:type I restriction enzyme, S subunit
VKQDWANVELGQLCRVQSGNSNTQDAVADGPYMFFDRSRYPKRSNRYLFDCEALIVAGEGAEFRPKKAHGKFDLHQRAYAIYGFGDQLLRDFLFFYLEHVHEYFQSVAVGATVKSLRQRHFENLIVTLPPLEEQKRIVTVLDQAFAALDGARANVEANLEDARGLFLGALRNVFSNQSSAWSSEAVPRVADCLSTAANRKLKRSKDHTQTGGRDATARPIYGSYSLSVLAPKVKPRHGWAWSSLSSLARLESGHTPSRKHPEYWGGGIGWISIRDAKDHNGDTILETREQTNDLGISKSSARVLPKGTICLSRTASVGYVVKMGADMATSQDFVNWICGPDLDPDFLMLLLQAQGDEIKKFSSGAVHQTIYFPEVKAFHVCHPDIGVQRQIASSLKAVRDEADKAEDAYREKLLDIAELRQSLLQAAFSGQLT